jgi:hypothetical protein
MGKSMTHRFILLPASGLSTIRGLIDRHRSRAPYRLLCRMRMLRLLYLLIVTTAVLAPYGCTAPAWWLADDSGRDDRVGSPRDLRAGSAIETGDSASAAEPGATPDKTAGQATNHNAIIEATLGGAAAHQDSGTTERVGRDAAVARSSAKETINSTATRPRKAAADPLVEEVHALGFNDPHEEASALAALRAAPPEHRKFLLRTMQASAAVRKQQERRAFSESRDSALPAQRRRAPVADANAIAPIEVEPAEESPNVVHQASYNDALRPDFADRLPAAPQARTPVNSTLPTTDWQSQLYGAIAALEAELAGAAAGTDRANLEAKLRLLHLVADRRDQAIRSRSSSSTVEQEFWSNELYGLATFLDSAKYADAKKRAALAAPHLRQAADRLGEFVGLVVKNLHFCTEVKGYGSFVTFPQDEFRLGQEVLLYCEVENFQSELREKGYHTALKARYEVFNAGGERVADKDLGLKDEHCQNRRRDFFVPYFIWMPKQAPPGKYQLKLTLEDVHAGQTAEATIEFEIKGK